MAVRYASIFAKKYGSLVRYAFFAMVRVRYIGTVRFKNWTEVPYADTVRLKVRGTYHANSERTVPYCHPCLRCILLETDVMFAVSTQFKFPAQLRTLTTSSATNKLSRTTYRKEKIRSTWSRVLTFHTFIFGSGDAVSSYEWKSLIRYCKNKFVGFTMLNKSNLSLFCIYLFYRTASRGGGAHLRVIVPAGNTAPFEEMFQQWRAVDTIAFDLTGPRFESQTSCSRNERVNARSIRRGWSSGNTVVSERSEI